MGLKSLGRWGTVRSGVIMIINWDYGRGDDGVGDWGFGEEQGMWREIIGL